MELTHKKQKSSPRQNDTGDDQLCCLDTKKRSNGTAVKRHLQAIESKDLKTISRKQQSYIPYWNENRADRKVMKSRENI
jgi:hypothetical protein